MQPAPIPADDSARIAVLESLEILDTGFEPRLAELVELAAYTAHTPMAALSLIDHDRQWFKSSIGIPVPETDRDVSFCGHTIVSGATFVVNDTLLDERFADNPLVEGEPRLRFYAGAPIIVDDQPIGTLCVLDTRPRPFHSDERRALEILARQVEGQLELRRLDDS